MAMRFIVVAGPDRGRVFPLHPTDTLLIGRSRATGTRLADPHVSRIHCEVTPEGADLVVNDFDSAGGTFVNGIRVTKHLLRPGEILRIGTTEMQLLGSDESDTSILMPPPRDEPVAAHATEQMAGFSGKTISHYQIGDVLAQGHSGVVFHARDTESGGPVAFKILWPHFANDDKQKQRFIRAMKTVMPLQHPNLVRVLGAGRSGGSCWLAMEYVEGENLTQVIQRIGTAGMLDWRYGLRVAIHVARGLELAHSRQIIHRNVTPMNIMVTARDKVAKLGDLMLAKALEGELAQAITGPGELLGDVRYMSPERTHSRTSVDGRSDIYSLGATVYALLTGRPPFEAESLTKTVMKIRSEEPVRPKKFHLAIPDLLEGAVMRMLAKRPDDRFASAAELRNDIERIAAFQGLDI